jgi:transposase-like protein
MGRRSKLTPEQWEEIKRRHIVLGESVNSLAKKYGINEKTIRIYLGQTKTPKSSETPNSEQKTVKESIQDASVTVLDALKSTGLPEDDQRIALELATSLNGVRSKLSETANNNLEVALELSKISVEGVRQLKNSYGIDVDMLKQLQVLGTVTNNFAFLGNEVNKSAKAKVEVDNDLLIEGGLPL